MNKFYKGSFYPKALKEVYISAGSWPENGVDVDDETMAIYTGVAPQGKTLGADKNGNPAWIDIPPLSAEQQIIAKWHLNRSQFGIRIDHDLASISDHSLASQSITIWHASDH
ncbi:tail fiber assembly protein [Escherichia coli]|nr:tail fiber assembly protein [Escherichia coli]